MSATAEYSEIQGTMVVDHSAVELGIAKTDGQSLRFREGSVLRESTLIWQNIEKFVDLDASDGGKKQILVLTPSY